MGDAAERSEIMSTIARTQAALRQRFATGNVPVEDEIKTRAQTADLLLQLHDQLQQPQYVYDAIEHLETILRRLAMDSPERPKHLNSLSYAKMSEHMVSNSRRALDEAVNFGRQARTLSSAKSLLRMQSASHFQILNNLGYALSQRFALAESAEDLDEAIDCAREIYNSAPKDSDAYQMTLNNLASRLRMRYVKTEDVSDIDEALRLINELLSMSIPGTVKHGMAVGQLGIMAADKFKRTDKLEDLDEALANCKIGLEALPPPHETRVAMLRKIVELLSDRHRKTKDAADLKSLADYSGLLFHALPSSHTGRGPYLLSYLRHIHEYAFASESLPVLEEAISLAQTALKSMPSHYSEKHQCEAVLANLLGKKYTNSRNTEDILTLVNYTRDLYSSFNSQTEKEGSTRPSAKTTWLYELRKWLSVLIKAPNQDRMRISAEQAIFDTFRLNFNAQSTALKSLELLYQDHRFRLQAWTEAIENGRVLSDAEVTAEEARLKAEKAEELDRRQKASKYRSPEYKTELGLRKLAIDPETKNVVMDLSGLMNSMLGYDSTERVSPEEFVSREARGEQESVQKALLDGRHPNLKLCRMCRDFNRILQPTAEGFELTSKNSWLPFGNFFQLRCRESCSICRLILSIISTDSGALHPTLDAVDREIQGVRLSRGTLSTGERLIRVDYGMRHVGELRMLTSSNYRQALRQAWQTDPGSSLAIVLDDSNSPIYRSDGQQVNPAVIRSWLNNCDHNHGSACNYPRAGGRTETDIEIILIDVVRNCLIKTRSHKRYFTLSYVWGKTELLKTLRSNLDARQKPGALSAIDFPKTIEDAMLFVRSLGERYLWVDALCLIQDDEAQMSKDIPNMDIIYGGAFATIVALHGSDANAGLPGVSPATRPPQHIEAIVVSDKSPTLDYDPDSANKETISLVATPVPLHLALKASTWNSRGWILQERLLSRRCIYFSADSVYFQCTRETLNEIGANEDFKSYIYDNTDMNDEHILRNANRDNPLFDLKMVFDLEAGERLKASFSTYRKLVETYTRRNLSFKSDILNAFAGMFAVLEEHFQSNTFHGLPAAVFSHAVLWTPTARLPRRGTKLPTMSNISPGQPDPRFPSWSWAGWDGPVEYRLFEEVGEFLSLPQPLVRRFEIGRAPETLVINVDDALPTADMRKLQTERAKTTVSSGPAKKKAPKSPGITGKQDGRILAKMIPDPDRNSTWVVMPPEEVDKRDPPLAGNLLRFTARTVPITAFQITSRKEYLSTKFNIHSQSPQAIRRIHDRNGKHCGLWWEQAGYGYVGLGMSSEAESKIEMVEISAYGDAYRRRKGPDRVEGEIRIFDDDVFPAVGPGSGLVNLLVVDFDMGHADGVGDRCTVAVIHREAWEAVESREREIQLA